MAHRCSVFMCNRVAYGHKFPKDPTRVAIWLKAIRRDNWLPSKYSHVCKYHFLPEDYSPKLKARDRLKKNAVPSQFPWNVNSSFEEYNSTLKTRRRERATKSSLVILKPSEVNKKNITAMEEQGNQNSGKMKDNINRMENTNKMLMENIDQQVENKTQDTSQNIITNVSNVNVDLLAGKISEQQTLHNNSEILSENIVQQAENTTHQTLEKNNKQEKEMNYQTLENGSEVSINVVQLSENITDETMKTDYRESGIDHIERSDNHEDNFDQIDKDGGQTAECRACLLQLRVDRLFSLFQAWAPTWEGLGPTVAEDLSSFSNVELSESDIHSKFICYTCCEKLWNACHFKMLVQDTDRLLKQRIPDDSDRVWPQPIQVDKSINVLENNFPFDVDIKQEVLSDDDLCNMEESYADTNLMDIKVEPEEILEQPPIVVNGVTSLKDFPSEDDPDSYWKRLHAIKEEPISENEESEMPLECLLCTKTFNSISGLKAHVIAQHSYQAVGRGGAEERPPDDKHVCALCRRTFSSSTDLMVHETCHNKYACYVCNAKFDTFSALSRHRKRCKTIAKTEVKRPKMLDDVLRPQMEDSLLKERDPKEKCEIKPSELNQLLSCPYCSEIFTDPYYVKIHQEMQHNKETEDPTAEGTAPMEVEMLESIFNEET